MKRLKNCNFSLFLLASYTLFFGTFACQTLVAHENSTATLRTNPTPKAIQYSSNFKSALTDWEPSDPECWKAKEQAGKHLLSLFKKPSSYKPKFRSPTHLTLLKGHSVGDFQLDADILSTHADYPHRDVCLFFGYQSPTKFYYVHLGKKTDPRANQIFIVNGSERTKISLTTNSGTPWDDQWHKVRVTRQVQTGKINVFFDNMQTPAMTAQDKTFAWGRVGVGSFDDTADFGPIKLSGKAAGPASTPENNLKLPATVRPVSKEAKWWKKRQQRINKRIEQGNVDLVFIGDSITQGWEKYNSKIWKQYYSHRKAANLGISGDRTQHVLWRLQNGNLKGISPKLAVLMIGTNNSSHDAPQDVAQGVKAILKEIQKQSPSTKILLLDIFPRGENDSDSRRAENIQTNKIIATFADNSRIFYLEIGPHFLDKQRKLSRKIMPDLLHPNKQGYQIWAKAIESKVQELLGENEAAFFLNEKISLIIPENASVQELTKFINDAWRSQPKSMTRASHKKHILKVFPKILEATNAILATSNDLEEQIWTIDKKLTAYRVLAMYDETAKAKGETLAEKYSTNPRNEIAVLAVSHLLGEASKTLREASAKEAVTLLNKTKAYINRFGINHKTYGTVYHIGRDFGNSPHRLLGADLYEHLILLLRKSKDKQLGRITSLEGAVRRFKLLGNKIEVFGTLRDGKEINWSDYQGKVVLIDFWASWCAPCIGELPGIKKNLEKYGAKGFTVIGVNLDSNRQAFEDCLKAKEITWENLFSEEKGKSGWNAPMARHYGISGIPTAILVNQEGRVVSLRARGEALDQLLKKLLDPNKK